MKKEFLYISNQISVLRILLVIPLVFLLINQNGSNTIYVAAILVAMYVSDLLDGYLARKLNQVSELGKIIDPLADKIAVVSIVIILFIQGRVETWFFVVVIARDLLILLFGLYLKSRNKIVLMSNYPGKIAVFSIGVIILLTVFNNELLQNVIRYLYYISVILIIYSLYLYLLRFYKSIGD